MPKATTQDNGKRKDAKGRERDGQQLLAMVRLMVQCGLGNTDISEINWRNVDLENGILDYDRDKPEWLTDAKVWRKMPLLQSTVDALKAWREFEAVRKDGLIFSTQQKTPFNKTTICRLIKRVSKAAGIMNKTAKNLRNVGSTVSKRNRLSIDERQAFLGHENTTTAAFYEDEMEYDYLANLVALIGKEYDL